MSEGIEVEVTARHIERSDITKDVTGHAWDPGRWDPVAQAIRGVTGADEVIIGALRPGDEDSLLAAYIDADDPRELPDTVQRFIARYDHCDPVKPFTFTM